MEDNIKIIPLSIVNAYLVKTGDGFILIDTGVAQKWTALERELITTGCLPDKLKLVIVTHGDFDHTGNCARLQEKYKVKIAMHKNDAPMVETGVIEKRTIRSPFMRLFIAFATFAERFKKDGTGFNKFKADLFLSDGQSLSEFGFKAKIHYLPGHTKGSIAILSDEGSLFAGDLVSSMGGKPNIAPIIDNIDSLKESISKLKKLKIKMVYPGHGKPFSGEALLKVIDHN